jgi:hypothetical protein
MKAITKRINPGKGAWRLLLLLTLSVFVFSCAGDPRKVDVQLPESAPEAKVTSFTEALYDLGLMTEIYDTGLLKIQSNPIGDNTGTAMTTGGEIPRDITEIMKSSLNSIGGNVIYIPYDPAFIQNQMVTGYSSFENKIIPDVILSGGITEFDRGLVTRGENTDVSAGGEIKGLTPDLPSNEVKLRYGAAGKTGLARITLDFNLLDFQTMTGIAKMNTVNTMEVHKAVAGKELGISLFGQTFGLKGSVKKVQGRHAAVRLLVELSMVEIVGKHLVLPYWRLLGDDVVPDKVVMDALTKYYYGLNDAEAIASVQEWLFLYGHDVPQTGQMDMATQMALKQVSSHYDGSSPRVDVDTFLDVYLNIPVTQRTLARRQKLTQLYAAQSQQEAVPAESAEAPAEVYQEEVAPAESTAASQEAPAPVAEEQRTTKRVKKKGIGRILSDEEW